MCSLFMNGLSLDRARHHAGHDALVEEQEQYQHRHGDDDDVGEYVLPGQLIYCRCTFQAIFPGTE